MRVVKCPCCGQEIRDNPLWRGSRYDFNADYMRFEDAKNEAELKEVCEKLEFAANFIPFEVGPVTYYRRGKGGKWLYRVPNEYLTRTSGLRLRSECLLRASNSG